MDRNVKRVKFDQDKKSGSSQPKTPCKKCHKLHYGECRLNMSGCYKCGALDHISRNCTKLMIVCYGCNEQGHKLVDCPKTKTSGATTIRSVKEEKVEIPKPKARAYPMTIEEAKSIPVVIIGIIVMTKKHLPEVEVDRNI